MSVLGRLPVSLLNLGIRFFLALSRPLLGLANGLRWLRFRYHWLKPRPDDIWIITSPKAGTTWAQMIVFQLITGGRGEFQHILQVSPYCEQLTAKRETRAYLDGLPSPRILKTHLQRDQLRPPPGAKLLYVTRNAPDTLLSLYHHECLVEGFHIGLDDFVDETLHAGNLWFDHLASWWPHRNDPNVLHVRYEALTTDLEREIRRIATFCGIPIEEPRMPAILERCGFAYMKQHNDRFDFRFTFYDRGGPKGGFIRQGGVGGGRAELSAAQQEKLEAKVRALRQRLGISDSDI